MSFSAIAHICQWRLFVSTVSCGLATDKKRFAESLVLSRIAKWEIPEGKVTRKLSQRAAVFGIRKHPVPEPGRENWRAGFDDRMERLGHRAIRFWYRGDIREHVFSTLLHLHL